MKEVKDLKITLRHLGSCLKDVSFKETLFGGYFVKGGRKINVIVLPQKGNDRNYMLNESKKIRKMGNEFGVALHPDHTASYVAIQDLVKKGLGIR